MSDKYQSFRQYISNFLHGKENAEALLQALADEAEKLTELSVAVTNQLTISTASGIYLDKRLAEVGITRPADLGVDDLAFKKLGIQLTATKQISEAIHAILETFYGEETVRASTRCTNPEPYFFEEGDDLILTLEDGNPFTITISSQDAENIQQATAKEVADLITRAIRARDLNGYAQVYIDVDTGNRYVEIFGGARGPYSFVQILGGRMQNEMEFPTIRATDLPLDDTVWEITRTEGQTHRFRWVSGSKPLLENVFINDYAMIYGNNFEAVGISGTFKVTNVSPPQAVPSLTAGWFEVTIENFSVLRTTPPGTPPLPNTPFVFYSFTVAQTSYNDLKFFQPKKNTPYNKTRYALAWEPASGTLKIYIPATTKVVKRDLIGAAHIHLLYPNTFFNGAYGSTSNPQAQIEILNPYSFRYKQKGYDNIGYGGTITYQNPLTITKDIDYIFKEGEYTTVVTKQPHDLPGLPPDAFGRVFTDKVVTVTVSNVPQDDPDNKFLGAYVIDPKANYTLTSNIVKLRQIIIAGQNLNTLIVSGKLPDKIGYLLLDLNKDTEEGPVKYLASQFIGHNFNVNIQSISQNGTIVTVNTVDNHLLVPGQQITITGTVNFNGVYSVVSVPDNNTFIINKTPPATILETTGQVLQYVEEGLSTVILDSSYNFIHNHALNADATEISDTKAYTPRPDGSDYGFYITSTAEGRVYAEGIIQQISALGINFEIIIVYPDDNGLGHWIEDDPQSGKVNDKVFVWGT